MFDLEKLVYAIKTIISAKEGAINKNDKLDFIIKGGDINVFPKIHRTWADFPPFQVILELIVAKIRSK